MENALHIFKKSYYNKLCYLKMHFCFRVFAEPQKPVLRRKSNAHSTNGDRPININSEVEAVQLAVGLVMALEVFVWAST